MKKFLAIAGLVGVAIAALSGSRAGVVFIPQRATGAGPCIIDQLSIKPSAAYALRRLSCSVPAAVEIFRVSDTARRDIGFIGEALNTVDVAAFCAGTTCNISKWYDQSGNGRNTVCVAGSFSICPQIWASGPSATVGGRPAGLMNSTFNDWLSTNNGAPDSGIIGTNTGGIIAVANAASGDPGTAGQGWFLVPAMMAVIPAALNSSVAGIFLIQGGAAFSPPSFISNRYLGVGGGGTDISIPVSYTYGTDGVFAMRFDAGDPTPNKTYFNGGTPQTDVSVASNNAPQDIQIGGITSFPTPFVGKIAEGYVFAAEPSLADTNLLGNDIATWFGLTWTNITL